VYNISDGAHHTRNFIAALAVFILLSLAAVAFLYYQNQQLKSMLANSQTASQILSPTPISTENWKTYSSSEFGFEILYPADVKISTRSASEIQIDDLRPSTEGTGGFPSGSMIIVSKPQPNKNKLSLREWAKTNKITSQDLIDKGNATAPVDTTFGGYPAINWTATGGDTSLAYFLVDGPTGLTLITINPPNYDNVIGRVLSTFLFISPSPSPSPSAKPVACTLEAKICPDGSSVGRTGPNCEFAPCPTP
jgi:hypothetical protein